MDEIVEQLKVSELAVKLRVKTAYTLPDVRKPGGVAESRDVIENIGEYLVCNT